MPIRSSPVVPVSAACTEADSGGAPSLRIAVVAEPFTGVRPTAPVGEANPVGSAEAGSPEFFKTVVVLNCGISPVQTGPITVTVVCADAVAVSRNKIPTKAKKKSGHATLGPPRVGPQATGRAVKYA